MSARDTFLQTVRSAVRSAELSPMPEVPAVDSPGPGQESATRLFIERAKLNGATVREFDSEADLRTWLTDTLAGAVWVAARRKEIRALVPTPYAGHEGAPDRILAERAEFGIGAACAAIADTGALVVRISSEEDRFVSLLPSEHIAVLRRKDVYASLHEAVQAGVLADATTGTHILIGGPSRTADIEKVLVTGVHGPRALVVALLP